MKKAVGYFRVSTKKEEQKESLKNQREIFLRFIKQKDYQLEGFYVDKKTGTIGKRKNFIKMLDDAEKGLFDIIIVKELSRLARNQELAIRVKTLTQNKRVRILSLDGQVDTFDPEKNKNFGLYAWLYQNEAEVTSTRIKSTIKEKQKRGQFLGSLPPYGYRIENKTLVPRGDYTADVVKLIYTKYLHGWGQDKIARYLTKLEHPTPAQLSGKCDAGLYWHGSTVKKILTNPHYLGNLVQHRETTFDVVNKTRRQVPKEEQIIVENTHPALIDGITFQLVQVKVESKKQNGKVKRYLDNRHLLTGLLYCADCGAPLWYRDNRQGYICGAYAKHGKKACTNHAIREQHLLSIIKKDLQGMIALDADALNLDKKISAFNRKSAKSSDKLENQISNLKKKNKMYLDMLIDGVIDEDTCKDYAKINNEEINRLQTELADLNTQQTKQRPDLSAIRSEIVKVINLEVLDRELLNMLIDRIEVKQNGELKVVYTFSSPIQSYNYKELKSS